MSGARGAQQAALLAPARRFAEDLDSALAVQAVVVFGSVARRDCHDHSDVDVLVVAHNLPERALDRKQPSGSPRAGRGGGMNFRRVASRARSGQPHRHGGQRAGHPACGRLPEGR
ncbi:MAG: nucleotidyltransferase domain-containing protein [Actinomycetota bacterium]|nr:nucleotidyltransferase domain-containing protein [Actinomycetota bacterium]